MVDWPKDWDPDEWGIHGKDSLLSSDPRRVSTLSKKIPGVTVAGRIEALGGPLEQKPLTPALIARYIFLTRCEYFRRKKGQWSIPGSASLQNPEVDLDSVQIAWPQPWLPHEGWKTHGTCPDGRGWSYIAIVASRRLGISVSEIKNKLGRPVPEVLTAEERDRLSQNRVKMATARYFAKHGFLPPKTMASTTAKAELGMNSTVFYQIVRKYDIDLVEAAGITDFRSYVLKEIQRFFHKRLYLPRAHSHFGPGPYSWQDVDEQFGLHHLTQEAVKGGQEFGGYKFGQPADEFYIRQFFSNYGKLPTPRTRKGSPPGSTWKSLDAFLRSWHKTDLLRKGKLLLREHGVRWMRFE